MGGVEELVQGTEGGEENLFWGDVGLLLDNRCRIKPPLHHTRTSQRIPMDHPKSSEVSSR